MQTTILTILLIGFSTGLRTMTAPAVVAWAAYLGCIDLTGTPFAFMASWIAVAVWSVGALGEYVVDLLPQTPSRTRPIGLIGRFLTGSFAGACLLAATGLSPAMGLLAGAIAIGAAFAGYTARTSLVRSLDVRDAVVAIPEDVTAILIAALAACLVR